MSASVLQLVLLSTLAQSPAAWMQVQAHIQPLGDAGTSLSVGAPFQLVIEAQHSPGSIALLPRDLGLPAALEERSAAREHRRTPGQDKDLDVYVLELLAFETGEHQIPAIPLALGSTTAASPALSVVVTSVLSADEQMVASSTRPEALTELERFTAHTPPAETVLVPDYRLFWVLGAALFIVGLALWLSKRSSKKKGAQAVLPPPPPPRPAHEVALEALERLQKADPLATGRFKDHYTELSTILRTYVGARYGFDSVELTYDELSEALHRRKTPGLDTRAFESLVFSADQVKFAKYIPLAEDGYAALKTAEQIVQDTRVRPEPTKEPSA